METVQQFQAEMDGCRDPYVLALRDEIQEAVQQILLGKE